jgi:hypothetical protein
MKVLNLNSKIDPDGHLRLDLPVNLSPGNIEVILVINTIPDIKDTPPKYDFSDLAGKLTWHGDSVAVQKSLRDEW